jgi:hypothetical protein
LVQSAAMRWTIYSPEAALLQRPGQNLQESGRRLIQRQSRLGSLHEALHPTTQKPMVGFPKEEAMTDELDPRDGPTAEFKTHHEITSRAKVAGKRVTGRLEILLDGGDIRPEQHDAGVRYANAYEVVVGSSSSIMYRGGVGGGDAGPEWKLDQTEIYRLATADLMSKHGYVGGRMSPATFMVEVCVKDTSFKELGRSCGLPDERVRTQAALMLQTLGRFFEWFDRGRGVNRTPGTVDQVKKRLDPEDAA